jgi:integrase
VNAWKGPGLLHLGARHDRSSPTHARRHAGAEFLPAHPDVLRAAGVAVRPPLSAIARRFGPEEIRAYQLYLTNDRKLAVTSILIAVAALRFLYTVTLKKTWAVEDIIPAPKKPQRLPVVLSPDEVLQFLDCVPGPKHRAILTTCYAAGLRISEVLRLRPTDIDSRRMVIRVEQGKGQKDRYVMLSPKLLELLRVWWRTARPTLWLFPGARPEQPVSKDAVEQACQRARRRSRIVNPISPHAQSCICCTSP